MKAQRGFTLIETLIAAAIAMTIGWTLLVIVHATVSASAHLDARAGARTAIDRLDERMESDATSAWSVFVPDADVLGGANADGHEVDFVTENGAHERFWWAYTYDATAHAVTRYAYAPGKSPAAGEQYAAIDAFDARTYAVTDLHDRSSAIYDPLLAGATATPVEFDYGWNPRATGGNHLVRAHIAGEGVDRVTLLSSGTAPSHFTAIVEYTPAPVSTP